MNRDGCIVQIERRLSEIFTAYAEGRDVAQGQLFRTEGFIEASCSLELLTEAQAQALIVASYEKILKKTFPLQSAGIQIPVAMQRAPVYPSS